MEVLRTQKNYLVNYAGKVSYNPLDMNGGYGTRFTTFKIDNKIGN